MDNNEVVPPAFFKSVQDLRKEVNELIQVFTKLSDENDKLVKSLSNTSVPLKQLINISKDLERVEYKLAEAEKQISDLQQKETNVKKQLIEQNSKQTKSVQEINKVYQENKKAIEESNSAHSQNAQILKDISVKAYNVAAKSIDNQRKQYLLLQNELKSIQNDIKLLDKTYANNPGNEKYLAQKIKLIEAEQNQKISVKQLGDTIKYNNQIISTQIGTYDNVSAQYSRLKIAINGMTEAEKVNGFSKKELEIHANSLYQEMSNLQKATGKNTLDVGKYDLAVRDLTQTLSILDPRIGTIFTRVQRITPIKNVWIKTNESLIKSLNITSRTATILQAALVGLVAGGIFLAVKAWQNFQKEQQRIKELNDIVTKSLSSASLEGSKNAQRELSNLEVLYKATQNLNKPQSERLKAAKELQKIYPDYLGNLSQEEILAGKGSEAYNKLSSSILNTAYARAAQEKIVENRLKQLDLEYKVTDLNAQRQIEVQKKLRAETNLTSDSYGEAGITNVIATTQSSIAASNAIDKIDSEVADLIREIQKLADVNKTLADGINIQDLLRGDYSSITKRSDKEAKALKDLEEYRLNLSINTHKKILDNNKISFEERISFLNTFIENQKESLIKSRDSQLKQEELTKSQLELINLKSEVELQKITEEGEKILLNIIQDYSNEQVKVIQESINEKQQVLSEEYQNEILLLSKSYANGELIAEEYQNKRKNLTIKFRNDQLNLEIKSLQNILSLATLTEEERENVEKNLGRARLDYKLFLINEEIDAEEDRAKKIEDIESKLQEKRKELLNETYELIKTLIQAGFENQLSSLEKEQEEADKKYEKDLKRIDDQLNSEVISEEQADARRTALENQKQQREEEADQKRKEILRKQAAYEKASAIAKAVIDTAAGIIKYASTPATAVLIPWLSALGAVQLATIIAQPLPQYAEGTRDHIGGLALVGEGGKRELIVEPGGKSWITNGPSVIDLPLHTQVFPDIKNLPFDQGLMLNDISNIIILDNKPVVLTENKKQLILQEKNNELIKELIRRQVIGKNILDSDIKRFRINNTAL